MIFLQVDHVLELHDEQITLFGGSFGLRDESLLLSALEMPKQSFGGELLHAFPFEMAAAYLFHVSKNHPFVDGNKRTAAYCMEVFLKMNGHEIIASDADLEKLVLDTATGKMDKKQIAAFLEEHCQKIQD